MKPPFTLRARGFAFLSVLMLFILLLAIGATAEGGGVTLFDAASGKWQPDYTQKAASVGGTLYVARMDGLYAWNMGEEPRQLMNFSKTGLDGAARNQAEAPMAISQLMSEDGVLYALDGSMEGLWRFDEGAGVFTKEASFRPEDVYLNDGEGNYYYMDYLMDGGEVYCVAVSADSGIGSLVRLNAKSGKSEVVRSGICLAASYTPGKLLVADGSMGRSESVSVLDLDTGRLTKKLDIGNDVKRMYYEIGLDTLYLVRKGAIYTSVAFGETKLAVRIPVLSMLSGGTQLNGGYAALTYEDGVRVYKCDPAAVADESLTLVGHSYDLPLEDYSTQHPGVTFAFSDFYPMNTAELVTHMMSGDGAADIYMLYIGNYNLDALYENGYFAGLEGSSVITEAVGGMYPFIKDQLTRDGKILALPYNNNYTVNMHSPGAFEEVGLSSADVPTTYEGLLDFIALWGEKYREEYSAMSLFGQTVDTVLYKRIVAEMILKDRMYACIRRDEPVTYDTKEMRALLDKLMATDFAVVDALAPDASNREDVNLMNPLRQLFWIGGWANTQKATADFFSYMPLRLANNEEPVIVSTPQVLIINPYSRNFDAALAFVEYVAANLPDTLRTDIMPGHNEPVRNPGFDVAMITDTISKLEEIVKTAKEEDKRSYQDQLDMWRQQLNEAQRSEWLATRESIAAFRALDSYFVFQQPNPLAGMSYNEEFHDLFYKRFLQGQITAEQFLKEMDQKMRMIERED